MKLSVDIICTVKDEMTNISELIDDMNNQIIQPNKVIIVDGGSSDGTYEYLLKQAGINKMFIVIQDLGEDSAGLTSPIARGRNMAINASKAVFLLMVDAGCRYHENWVGAYVKLIERGDGCELLVGGSKLSGSCTSIDIASAPMLGFCLPSSGYSAKPTGTCRSLGISKALFLRLNGFTEISKTGEDTDFFLRAKKNAQVVPVPGGAAIYTPGYSFLGASSRLFNYASGDGSYSQSKKRFIVMLARSISQISGVVLALTSLYQLLLLSLMVEMFFAYRFDALLLLKKHPVAIIPRLFFSLTTPYLYVLGYIRGAKGQQKQK